MTPDEIVRYKFLRDLAINSGMTDAERRELADLHTRIEELRDLSEQ